jgi:signal transduction histidine kinase
VPRAIRDWPVVSLRGKILLIVLGGGMLPLALIALWLTHSAQRSGETLLRNRLDSTLARATRDVGVRWVRQRSALLSIAEDTVVRRLLRAANEGRDSRAQPSGAQLAIPPSSAASLRAATALITIRDAGGRPRWVVDADASGAPILLPAADSLRVGYAAERDVLHIKLPISELGADSLGVVDAAFRTTSLVPATVGSAAGAGASVTVFDRATGIAVVTAPFDPDLLRRDHFVWGGETWLSATRDLDDPYIQLVAAAPLGAFTVPFEDAARRGFIALALVAALAIVIATILTRRATRSLVQLADAADAVARGDLDRHIEPHTTDEVGRLARAFNSMTASLRRMLAELAQRQAVVAVGEFASALAHEVRNPLTVIRLNLQHIEEHVAENEALHRSVARALRDIDRLETTVAGALRVARTGQLAMDTVDLRVPLEAALRAAAPVFAQRQVIIEPLPPEADGCQVQGNSAALEQLFLNLLLNAGQACSAGARVGVRVELFEESAKVTVWDTGVGFEPAAHTRAFEPFFTTKAEGTGLGLTVARRVVDAHGGTITIESEPGAGSNVHVVLRLARAASGLEGRHAALL